MVMYCSPDHQKDDWQQHKEECKVFRCIGLHAAFYRDADMLARFPLKPPPADRFNSRQRIPAAPAGASCALCLKGPPEVAMTTTCCCLQPVCDTEGEYQLMSYSREFCPRSHNRYTLCGCVVASRAGG